MSWLGDILCKAGDQMTKSAGNASGNNDLNLQSKPKSGAERAAEDDNDDYKDVGTSWNM